MPAIAKLDNARINAIADTDVTASMNSAKMYNAAKVCTDYKDLLEDDVIDAVVKAFEEQKVDSIYGDLEYVDAHNTSRVTRTWKAGIYKKGSFYWGWMPPHPTFFVRKKVYDQVGLFDTRLHSAADYEMMLRIMVRHHMQAAYIPEFLVKMRRGGISNASIKNRIRANREDREAWRINGLTPYFFTLYLKPLRKINQFIKK